MPPRDKAYVRFQDGSGTVSLRIQTLKKSAVSTRDTESESGGVLASILRRSRSREINQPPPPDSSTEGTVDMQISKVHVRAYIFRHGSCSV